MGLKRDILIGLCVFGVLALIIGAIIGLVFLLIKSIGMLLILAGIFLIVFFPGAEEEQKHEMSKTGIVIGIIVMIVGIWLILA